MEVLPIIVTGAYLCMGVYNGVKTVGSMYNDAKKIKGYIGDKMHKMNDAKCHLNVDDSNTFVLLSNDSTTDNSSSPERLVTFDTFTMI
jgi:hypothetical protein